VLDNIASDLNLKGNTITLPKPIAMYSNRSHHTVHYHHRCLIDEEAS
jgi:hypothetical protein